MGVNAFAQSVVSPGQGNQEGMSLSQRSIAKFNFYGALKKASTQLDWGKTYYSSYKKTRQVAYLKLAAENTGLAAQTLLDTENTPGLLKKFFYKAKRRRKQVCNYYQVLYLNSLNLEVEHHLPQLNELCSEY